MKTALNFNDMKIDNILAYLYCEDCKKPTIRFEGNNVNATASGTRISSL